MFHLRSFVCDFGEFHMTIPEDTLASAKKLVRDRLKQIGWKVVFSNDRVYATKGKERRHFFLSR